ncbi:MAG: endonuclease/exonuclease/phosphatase family protein [Actinomycetota bacterium]|nr:endonuclease/exonuclease/phosphatase family protein [Actinomycetota bacterium]
MRLGRGSRMLRVITWNVRHLRDDAGALAAVLRALDPDVVCLQETPRGLRHRARLAALARAAGLVVVAGGRSAGYTAVLAHRRTSSTDRCELLFPRRPGLHQRGVALVSFRTRAGVVAVGSVHLGLDAEERLDHVDRLLHLAAGLTDGPVVLGGDLNESPGGPAWRALSRRFADASELVGARGAAGPTYPARAPRVRIDAVFVAPAVRVRSADVPPLPAGVPAYEVATDHLPVLADLEL